MLLGPNSERSLIAFNLLNEQLTANVEADPDLPNNINIHWSPKSTEGEFYKIELLIFLLQSANSSTTNLFNSEEEFFIENSILLFELLSELKHESNNKGLWWELYIPFFEQLINSDYMDAYYYYICQPHSHKAALWLESNEKRVDAFLIGSMNKKI